MTDGSQFETGQHGTEMKLKLEMIQISFCMDRRQAKILDKGKLQV